MIVTSSEWELVGLLVQLMRVKKNNILFSLFPREQNWLH